MTEKKTEEQLKASTERERPKRFYETVSVIDNGASYTIALDERPVKTPLKQSLAVPAVELIEAIANEWRAQGSHIDHESMILTKLANTAIDRTANMRTEITDELIRFAGSDLLCYRAANPRELIEIEASAWDPVLSWLRKAHSIKLTPISGIIHQSQDAGELEKLAVLYEEFNEFTLTALHNMTTITGSAILPLALVTNAWSLDEIWAKAHIDEDYQIERWGEDAEAAKRRKLRRSEFDQTHQFYQLLRSDSE